jgi:hypothetical protein
VGEKEEWGVWGAGASKRGAGERRDVIGVAAAFTYQKRSTRPHPVRYVVLLLAAKVEWKQ